MNDDVRLPGGQTLDEYRLMVACAAIRADRVHDELFQRHVTDSAESAPRDVQDLLLAATSATVYSRGVVDLIGWISDRLGDHAAHEAAALVAGIADSGDMPYTDDLDAEVLRRMRWEDEMRARAAAQDPLFTIPE